MTTRLQPGDQAPDFTLLDDHGKEVTLSDLRGGKVIVYFYPAAMTPGCTREANDFTADRETFDSSGYTILGISPDNTDKLATFREKEGLEITLLSDPDKEVLRAWGAFGEKKLYGKVIEGVIRSTFVVDAAGLIEVAQYNIKATGHVERLIRHLDLA